MTLERAREIVAAFKVPDSDPYVQAEQLEALAFIMLVPPSATTKRFPVADTSDETLNTLRAAREKLQLYRDAHSGEYIGGMEFTALIRRIETAMAAPDQAMTLERAREIVQACTDWIGPVSADDAPLDGHFTRQELEAVLTILRAADEDNTEVPRG